MKLKTAIQKQTAISPEVTLDIAGLKKGRGGNQRVLPFVVPRKKNKLLIVHL
ncbi:MAG: hypothetical protein QMC67_00345 [Candidatus Wallbacteria bacterium]